MVAGAAGQAPVAERAPVDLRCNFSDPELRAAASCVIDDVCAQVHGWLGPAPNPPERLTMFVWGDVASCQAAAERAGLRPSRELPGFVTADGRAGHVLLSRAGWSRDEERRFAYVTARLVVARRLAAQPDSLRHGIAWLAVSDHALRHGRIEDRTARGYDDDLIGQAQHDLAQGHLVGYRDLLRGLSTAPQPPEADRDGRLVVLFASQMHGKAWQTALRQVADAGKSEDFASLLLRAITDAGGPVARDLDAQFHAWLARQDISRHKEVLVPDAHGQPDSPDFVPATPSVHWLDRWDKPLRSLTAEVTLRQGALQGDLILERAEERWLRVTVLAADDAGATGQVVVSERLPGRGNIARMLFTTSDPKSWRTPMLPPQWRVLARARGVAGLDAKTPVPVEVRWHGGTLTVAVAGRAVLATAMPSASVLRFGAGGPHFNEVAWRRIRIR